MKVLMAAAGTGGHINPAIDIANKIMEEDPSSKIIFIGTKDRIENKLVPKAGYELRHIEAYGLSKKISIDNFKKMFKTIFLSHRKVLKIMDEFKPDIVIGTGGYIGYPVYKAAKIKKIPIIFHESNAYPGKVVKEASKKADRILLGFEKAKELLPNKENAVVTGNPTKIMYKEITENERKEIFKNLGLDYRKKTILVTGGSQGAKTINTGVIKYIINQNKKEEENRSLGKEYQIIIATGANQYDTYIDMIKEEGLSLEEIKGAKILPYIYNMEDILNVCDLAICRSGAMTVTEISLVGIPAIYIPLESTGANRQEDNAKIFEDKKAAVIVKNSQFNEKTLEEILKQIMLDENLIQMRKNAKEYSNELLVDGKNICLDKIYEEIIKVLESRKR